MENLWKPLLKSKQTSTIRQIEIKYSAFRCSYPHCFALVIHTLIHSFVIKQNDVKTKKGSIY